MPVSESAAIINTGASLNETNQTKTQFAFNANNNLDIHPSIVFTA